MADTMTREAIFSARLDTAPAAVRDYVDAPPMTCGIRDPLFPDAAPETGYHARFDAPPFDTLGSDYGVDAEGAVWTFWDGDTRWHIGARAIGGGPLARREYICGSVTVTPAARGQRADVVILAGDDPAYRPYWLWLRGRIQRTFHVRRKGGPLGRPPAERAKIIAGWLAVEGTLPMAVYAAQKGVSVETLRGWLKRC